ncbi:MAG: aminodeoxychorismate synthase component I [Peptostreptococcaceae bacterium]|nr:aminodeoxychorismate synthase component I [Peptostreptococcaceae bacterium]
MVKEIPYKSAKDLYLLLQEEPFSFILESSLYHEKYGRYSIISASPFEVVESKNRGDTLDILKEKMRPFFRDSQGDLPFYGGAVGYLSYDAGRFFEGISAVSQDDVGAADLCFGLYDWGFVVDHHLRKTYIVTAGLDEQKEERILSEREAMAKRKVCFERGEGEEEIEILSNFDREEYLDAIERVREYIRRGDVYQVNLTQRFEGKTRRSALDLYLSLRESSPTLFAALLNFEKLQVISNSPERFLKIRDRRIETRPIKGTRPRGRTEEEDRRLKEELIKSEKDRAELLMIVDLERNDLGRVSEIGSVRVPELFVAEEYANVHHLVATVISEMEKDSDVFDVIRGTFPGGSITGAPKIRAMEIIEELEPTSRNVYTGSIGYIGFDGNADFNIAIRTIVKVGERILFQAGGGITWDSSAEDEYMESLHKAAAIMKVLGGRFSCR